MAGRKRIYTEKDANLIRRKAEEWFAAHQVVEPLWEDKEHTIPLLTKSGEQATQIIWTKKPTEYALCNEAFGITTMTWANYVDQYESFKPVQKWIQETIKDFLFDDGMSARNSSMHQFILQNCYGMRSKTELELGKETRDAAKEAVTGLANRVAFLQEVAREDED